MKKMGKTGILVAAALAAFTMISCSGDMHDSDESLRQYIVFSMQEQTLSIPKGTQFLETMEAYSVEGTYGSYNFSSIKITAGEQYTAGIVLKNSSGTEVFSKPTGTTYFTTEEDMTIKITSNSIIDLTKWNNLKITN